MVGNFRHRLVRSICYILDELYKYRTIFSSWDTLPENLSTQKFAVRVIFDSNKHQQPQAAASICSKMARAKGHGPPALRAVVKPDGQDPRSKHHWVVWSMVLGVQDHNKHTKKTPCFWSGHMKLQNEVGKPEPGLNSCSELRLLENQFTSNTIQNRPRPSSDSTLPRN